jgi:peptide/nickel transport system substrate-binding protein
MDRSRALRLACVACSSLLLLVACGDDADEDSSGTTDPASGAESPDGDEGTCTAERRGGEITMGSFSQPATLDPVTGGGNGRTGAIELAAIYDTLMRYDQASGEYEPRIAESAEVSDDGLTWTVTLREGVTFGNGDPLTAEDVQWNIERAQSDENVTPNKGVARRVTGMEVVDERTITMTLAAPWSDFPWLLSSQVGMMVNPRVYEATDPTEFGLSPPTGAGAGGYEVARFAPGEEIVLEAKEEFWDGAACIEELTFVRLAGGQATLDAMRAGEFDLGFLSTEPVVTAQAREEGFDAGVSFPIDAANVVLMNSGFGTSPITTDVRVRQAVVLALDPEAYDERMYEGQGTPSGVLIHPDSRLDPGVDGITPDRAAAQALVDEVMADTGWDGSIRLDCSENNAEQAIEVEGQLEAAGFDVAMTNNIDITEFLRRVTVDGDYELGCWAVSVKDEIPLLAVGQFTTDNPANYWGYANEAFDTAVADLASAPDDDVAREALGRIQQAFNEDPPVAILTRAENYIAAGEAVRGLVTNADWTILLTEAYLAEGGG